jgi:hypothetical protein
MHPFRPDVEAASLHAIFLVGGDFPGSPNSLAFVITLVEDIMLSYVALRPVAFAVAQGIAAT